MMTIIKTEDLLPFLNDPVRAMAVPNFTKTASTMMSKERTRHRVEGDDAAAALDGSLLDPRILVACFTSIATITLPSYQLSGLS
jgi:hypothetical protein